MLLELDIGEGSTFIRDVSLRYHPILGALFLEYNLGVQCLVCIQVDLWFHMNISSGVVDKDTPTLVFMVSLLLPKGKQ